MVIEVVAAILAGSFGAFDGGLKVAVLQIFQHFAEIAGRPAFDAVFVEAFDLLENGRVDRWFFCHNVVRCMVNIAGFERQT